MRRVAALTALLPLVLWAGVAQAAGPPITSGGWAIAGDNQPINIAPDTEVPPDGVDERDVYSTSLISVLGVPHVGWVGNNFFNTTPQDHIRAAKLSGTSWVQSQGHLGNSADSNASGIELEAFAGEMHFAWTDMLSAYPHNATNARVFVAEFDPANNGSYARVGAGENPMGDSTALPASASLASLTNVGDVPHVAYRQLDDGGNQWTVKAKRWNGSAWVPDGSGVVAGPMSSGPVVGGASVGGAFHVLYADDAGIGHVKRFDGTNWVELGTGVHPSDIAADATIAAIGSEAWVAYTDDGDIRVRRWTGSAWASVGTGTAPIDRDPARDAVKPSLTAIGGIAHIAWIEAYGGTGGQRQVHVSRLDSGEWRELAGNSVRPINVTQVSDADMPSLADIGGVPYVAWVEDRDLWAKKFGTNIVNTGPPIMGGTPQIGNQLSCSTGSWAGPPPDTFEWIWERAPGGTADSNHAAFGAIDGASGSNYTLQSADDGSQIRCRVFARDEAGAGEAVSLSKRAELGIPVNTVRPQINGTPIKDQELVCGTGTWTSGRQFTYRWLRDGAPIGGAANASYFLREDDGGRFIRCEVTSSNGLGTSGPVISDSVFAVNGPPVVDEGPIAIMDETSPNPLGRTVTCELGRWVQDYGTLGDAAHPYTFRWLREGQVIAGATEQVYTTTVEDLGRRIRCGATASNPAGRSDFADSNEILVPLPTVTTQGELRTAAGTNQFVPVNMLAVGKEYREGVERYIVERLTAAKDAETARCESRHRVGGVLRLNSIPPNERLAEPLSELDRCRILILHRFQVLVYPNGVKFQDRCTNPAVSCLDLGFAIPPVDPTRPPPIDPAIQAELGRVTPTQVLWDIDRDGETDVACPGETPVLRTMLQRGEWSPRAIIVYPDSAVTGIFSEATKTFRNPSLFSSLPRGQMRAAQPLVCRTSLEQPPEPQQAPCVTEGVVGRVRVTGNLCPISVRSLTESQIEEMRVNDGELFNVLVEMSEALERREAAGGRAEPRVYAEHGTSAGLMPRGFGDVVTRRASATIGNYASALPTFQPSGILGNAFVPRRVPENVLARARSLVEEKAEFVMDQIYIARDAMKVNGITVDPLDSAALIVPSDVKNALPSVQEMKLRATQARTQLGNMVLAETASIRSDISDRADEAGQTLLNTLRDAARKIDVGPFKISGDIKVKLEKDQTATIEAFASFDLLKDALNGTPTARVKLRGDREGNLKLEGITIELKDARLGTVRLKDIFIRYDNGLTVRGKIELPFPPSNPKIEIFEFRLGPRGEFQALDVRFSASPGIAVGPGIFLTALRAGLDLPNSTLTGGATLSAGPSPGGGCPTVGIDATFRVAFKEIVSFDAHGNIQIVCIGLVSVNFHADTTGYISLAGGLDFRAGPLFIRSQIGGAFKLPNWQIEYNGEGGIRGVPIIGTLSAQLQGVLSNRGMAVCGRVEVLFATLAAGAGVRFPNGRPPLTPAELFENIRIFTGCDLSSYRSLASVVGGTRAHAAQAGSRSFEIQGGDRGIALSIEGAGDAPRVRLRSPTGKTYDFTDAPVEGKLIDNAWGTVVEDEDRTVVLLRAPEQGRWTAELGEGSPAIGRIQRADVLPPARVTGTVGGIGSSRVLRYNIPRIDGQVVRLAEEANGAEKTLRTVRGGGRGTVRFTTSEANGPRRSIVAEVQQDGLPRTNVTVARFTAPNPKVGRARRVRVRRRGNRALITWRRAVNARRYDVIAESSDGERRVLTPTGRRLRVTMPGVAKRERLLVRIVGISAAGRKGPVARARLAAVKQKPARRRRAAQRRG